MYQYDGESLIQSEGVIVHDGFLHYPQGNGDGEELVHN